MTLNEAGRQFYRHSRDITSACEDTWIAMKQIAEQPHGTLRLATESEFGTTILGPLVRNCMRDFPTLKYEIHIAFDNPIAPEELDMDCVIYVGRPPDTQLVGKLLGDYTYGMFASGRYVQEYGIPKSIVDLASHKGVKRVKLQQVERWKLRHKGALEDLELRSDVTVNSYWMAKHFAVDGAGIAYLPRFFVRDEIDSGDLIPVLPQWRSDPIPVYLLYAKQRYKSALLKTFIDTCEDGFALLGA